MAGVKADPIKAAIVQVLNSIEDIGVVHSYERYAKNHEGMKELYQWSDQIRGWYVRQVNWRQVPSGMCPERTRAWEIRGFMSLDDDSRTEVMFDELLERINTAFNAKQALGEAVSAVGDANESGIQLIDSGPVLFSGVLCHSARLRLLTRSLR